MTTPGSGTEGLHHFDVDMLFNYEYKSEPDWVLQQSVRRMKEQLLAGERELLERLDKARKREEHQRRSMARVTKRPVRSRYLQQTTRTD